MKGYKFVSADMRSYRRDWAWKIGEWCTHDGKVRIGDSGFHASPDLYSAYANYKRGDRLFEVEARGVVRRGFTSGAQFAAKEMRLTREIDLKRLSVDYATRCARHVLDLYEAWHTDDKRPRWAIEAAEAYLKDPSERIGSTTWSAAESARSAAWSVVHVGPGARYVAVSAASYAASAAGSAAESATWSAAESVRSAESAVRSAAKSAAWSAKEKKWQKELLEELVKKYYL